MRSLYKNKDLLKNHPFYTSEIESNKKIRKKIVILDFCLNYHFFLDKSEELINKELSEELPFFPKKIKRRKKWSKRLTKYQILSNMLPFSDTVGIVRREHAHKGYAETYNVKVMDNRSLNDSLFLVIFSKKKY